MLRDAMPVEILELTAEEAPVKLTAKLSRNQHPATTMTLRHDGTSYLRPVMTVIFFDPRSSVAIPKFERLHFEAMLALTGSAPPTSINAPKSWLTRDNARDIKLPDPRTMPMRADEFPTAESIAPEVRTWVSTDAAEAQREVVLEAENYVLVDGHLHCRTTAPVLCWIRSNRWNKKLEELGIHGGSAAIPTAMLFDGAEREDFEKQLEGVAEWWPLSCASDFINLVPDTDFRLDVDAPLETDHANGILAIGRLLLRWVDHYSGGAVMHLSDAGLDLYKDYRRQRDLALEGDADAMVAAMETARAMSTDKGMVPGRDPSVGLFTSCIRNRLPHWDALMRSTGRALAQVDDDAMMRMTR